MQNLLGQCVVINKRKWVIDSAEIVIGCDAKLGFDQHRFPQTLYELQEILNY